MKCMLLIVFSCVLVACGGSHSPHKKIEEKTYIVSKAPIHKTLFFTGTVQPLKENALTSPMEAVVDTVHYHYGQNVKKDQVVFTLNSAELQKQYNDTLTEYLKAKDSYTIARAKFTGTEDLWQAGLLSKNNYISEKSSLNTARVTLMQAKGKLTDMLKKMGEGTQNLSSLSFAEFKKVRAALSGKHDLIHIKAPSDGVLLYPPKANDDKSGRVAVGSTTKAGEVLALVGDLSGIRVEIDVPEVDIDKIKRGMSATIRGVAFGKNELKGQLVAVNAQASASGAGGALPSFSAIVEVNNLDAKQQAWIKVGMSASIELAIDSTQKLLVPIAAVRQENGKSVVHVLVDKGRVITRLVVTGAAYGDKVIIDSGLKTGEVLTYE